LGEEKKLRETCKRLASKSGGVLLPLRGWLRGTPDALLVQAGALTLIEFKSPTGRLSAIQDSLFSKIREAGVAIHVINSLEQFRELLK
jgi:hypothetical protein